VHVHESLKIVSVFQWWIRLEYVNCVNKEQSHFFISVI